MKAADVLKVWHEGVDKLKKALEDGAARNPDFGPALVAFEALLASEATAERIAAAPIEIPTQVVAWLTQPSTDIGTFDPSTQD